MLKYFFATIFILLSSSTIYSQVNLAQGLMAYYPFAGNANDVSGNNNNPIFNNATLTSDKNGLINNAYHFNGVNTYMQIANSATLNMNTTITVCAMVKADGFYYGTCHGNSLVMKGNDFSSPGYYNLTFDDNFITSGANCSIVIPDTLNQSFHGRGINSGSSSFIKKTKWYSVIYTNDGITAKIYIDCKLAGSAPSTATFTNTFDLFFGKSNNTIFPYWFNGDLDEIRIYNRALNEDEINVYGDCANPTCKGVIELHGHDKITPPTPVQKYIPSTGFTWETWFNSNYYDNGNTSLNTRNKLISLLDFPNCQDVVLGFGWPTIAEKNTLCFVADGPNGCGDRDINPCKYFLPGGFISNTWYHVAAVKDYANNTSKLYFNGNLVDTKTNTHGPLNPTIIPGFIFGSWLGVGATDSGINGKMDEIKIWNYPRTDAEILANYYKCLSGNETGLIAYYKSNDKSGTVLRDASINNNHATISVGVVLNKSDNAPIQNTCTLSSSYSETKTICQGDNYWSYTITGIFNDTLINKIGCDSFRTLNLTVNNCNIPTASFTCPDTICVNTAISIVNTSTFATSYNWNFCSPNINSNIVGTNLGNFGGLFSTPVSVDYVFDNGNYYGFVVNFNPSGITRLDFGNSLLNTPNAVFLSSISSSLWNGGLGALAIKMVKQNNNWFAILTGGSTIGGNPTPRLIKLNFGNIITNVNPTVTDWGNIGNIAQPHQIHLWNENNIWYGLVFNSESNTLSRINFTNDFNNIPTGINLGNVGNLNFPSHFDIVNDNGSYRLFVTNTFGNSISRLDFGSSLLNLPIGINLGNISNNLSWPRGIKILQKCDEVYGYVVNQQNNTIVKINFNGALTSISTANSLGNVGNQNNSSTLSQEFIVGTDRYYFMTNSVSSSISILKLSGCNNSSISNLTSATPPAVSYNSVGTYNINLTIDEGLSTQHSYCKKVVVVAGKKDSINKTICQGEIFAGYTVAGLYRDTFNLTVGCDSIRVLKLTILSYLKDSINISICKGEVYKGFTVTGIYRDTIKSTTTCDSIKILNLTVRNNLNPLLLSDTSICEKDTLIISPGIFDFYLWNNGSVNKSINIKNVGTYWVTVSDLFGCKASDTFKLLAINPKPKNFLPKNLSICAGELFTLNGFVSYNWITGETTPTIYLQNLNIYSVKVLGYNNCIGIDSMQVNYIGEFNIIPLNAFSPNGDGINELFKPIVNNCITSYSLKIFDRSGQVVFETINSNLGWDGKFKGYPVPIGVYYYIINYKNLLGVENRKSGSLTLLR